jgi:hypothetical protein
MSHVASPNVLEARDWPGLMTELGVKVSPSHTTTRVASNAVVLSQATVMHAATLSQKRKHSGKGAAQRGMHSDVSKRSDRATHKENDNDSYKQENDSDNDDATHSSDGDNKPAATMPLSKRNNNDRVMYKPASTKNPANDDDLEESSLDKIKSARIAAQTLDGTCQWQ